MNDLESMALKMIAPLGAARSHYIESLKFSRQHEFDKAKQLIEEGRKYRVEGHNAHFELLQKDSNNELEAALPLLIIHAEDQLMSAETLEIMAEEFLETHQYYHKKICTKEE